MVHGGSGPKRLSVDQGRKTYQFCNSFEQERWRIPKMCTFLNENDSTNRSIPFRLTFEEILYSIKTCNPKGLGSGSLLSAFIFGISGTIILVLIGLELYSSGNKTGV